jgi:hypothetical protein
MKCTMPLLTKETKINWTVLVWLHKQFGYTEDVEYSGFLDVDRWEASFTRTKGLTSPFPWGKNIVFHTHPNYPSSDDYSYADIFLFCCSQASVSILLSKDHVSVLEKKTLDLYEFHILRNKLLSLKNSGFLKNNGVTNSLYFGSILNGMSDGSTMVPYKKNLSSLFHTLSLEYTQWKME